MRDKLLDYMSVTASRKRLVLLNGLVFTDCASKTQILGPEILPAGHIATARQGRFFHLVTNTPCAVMVTRCPSDSRETFAPSRRHAFAPTTPAWYREGHGGVVRCSESHESPARAEATRWQIG